MAISSINADMLKKAFLSGAQNLENNKDYINQLNVFPVPDGDTGSNMTMTIMSAAKEVQALYEPSMTSLAKAISSGSLRGARGNSGVILSQLFRGFCRGIQDKETITTGDLVVCIEQAVETAYKAVMKPKEGTILTVAKGMAVKAREIYRKERDIEKFCEQVIAYGNETLDKTPDMLPVLKEAGVVDSGGKGLMTVVEGAFQALLGKSVEVTLVPVGGSDDRLEFTVEDDPDAEITFGYCTEFIVILEKEYTDEDEAEFKEYLSSIGDSIVCVSDDELIKIHVHTNHPGLAFEKGLTYGSLIRMKIDNMREEHKEKIAKQEAAKKEREARGKTEKNVYRSSDYVEKRPATTPTPKKEEPPKNYGFIAVSVGEGMNEIFSGIGTDFIIEGGQTMNPSTEDILNAIKEVNAKTIFVFPNNKNIILAANQAQSLTEDKTIVVIPTKTVPQGISAILAFDPSQTVDDNMNGMKEAISLVKTGQVTYAVRDTSIDGHEIKMDDIMGIGDDGIRAVGKDVHQTTMELIDSMVDEDSAMISIYYGEDVEEDAAGRLLDAVEKKYKDLDVDLNYGGQPIYYYLVSVEA